MQSLYEMAKKVKVIHKKLGRYRVDGQQIDGFVYRGENKVFIDERLKGYSHLLTFVHEFYHIHNPDWSETKVKKKSSELAQALWRHGYRLKK